MNVENNVKIGHGLDKIIIGKIDKIVGEQIHIRLDKTWQGGNANYIIYDNNDNEIGITSLVNEPIQFSSAVFSSGNL